MKRILVIMMFVISVFSTRAQNVEINIDRKTIEAMGAAYEVELAIEKEYNEQIQDILKKYCTAELATNSIFASKFLEYRALGELGIWSSTEENYYYRRIYNLVAAKIIPKIVTVAKLMMQNPENALYWGSYLLKICDETKALCTQFQTIVTNSRLGFEGLNFLEMKPDVKQLFDLAHRNIINWDNMLQTLTSVPEHFSKEHIKQDINNLYGIGQLMAASMQPNIMDRVITASNFSNMMTDKVTSIYNAVLYCETAYGNVNSLLKNELKARIGNTIDPSRIFNLGKINIAEWLTDYSDKLGEQYYTQRWYIYNENSQKSVIANYNPPFDEISIRNSNEWYRLPTTDPNFQPNKSQLNAILYNSEEYAGWSRAKIKELNSQTQGYRYEMITELHSRPIKYGTKLVAIAYAYSISVLEVRDNVNEVEEATFDSYSMDLNAFLKQMELRLKEWNESDSGLTYKLGCADRNYYSASSAEKLKGVERVAFSVTCYNSTKLMNGNILYKCRDCKGDFPGHTKQCSMWTSVKEDVVDTSELDKQEAELIKRINKNNREIDSLNDENTRLLELIASAPPQTSASYREQIIKNQEKINTLTKDIDADEENLKVIRKQRDELIADSNGQVDAHYRIPAIMEDCKTVYGIVWSEEGHWSGTSFYRKGKVRGTGVELTFKATLKYAKDADYFLGIMIHRPLIQVEYELTSEQSNTDIVEVLPLSEGLTDDEREKLVNDRASEIARTYPECQVDIQYLKSFTTPEENTEDVHHLLWSSERLEIARGIDSRLHKIYADLISVEKMMNYKKSIIDILLSIAPPLDSEAGRRRTLIQQAHRQWLNNAAKTSHSNKYNGKYEDFKRSKK